MKKITFNYFGIFAILLILILILCVLFKKGKFSNKSSERFTSTTPTVTVNPLCGTMNIPNNCSYSNSCKLVGKCCDPMPESCDTLNYDPGTCKNRCGSTFAKPNPGSCSCDSHCKAFGDCCNDYEDKCDNIDDEFRKFKQLDENNISLITGNEAYKCNKFKEGANNKNKYKIMTKDGVAIVTLQLNSYEQCFGYVSVKADAKDGFDWHGVWKMEKKENNENKLTIQFVTYDKDGFDNTITLDLKRCYLNKDSCGPTDHDYFYISNYQNDKIIIYPFMTKYFDTMPSTHIDPSYLTFITDDITSGGSSAITIKVDLTTNKHFNVPTLTIEGYTTPISSNLGTDTTANDITEPVQKKANALKWYEDKIKRMIDESQYTNGLSYMFIHMDTYKIHYRDLMFSILDYESYELFGVKQIWYDDVSVPDEEFFFHIRYDLIASTYPPKFNATEIIGDLGTALGPKTLFEFKTITKQ